MRIEVDKRSRHIGRESSCLTAPQAAALQAALKEA
jgi:hypothetical protein